MSEFNNMILINIRDYKTYLGHSIKDLYRQFILSLIFHDCDVLSLLNILGQSKRNSGEDQPDFSQCPRDLC